MVSESIERALQQIHNGATQLSLYSQRIGDIGATSLGRELNSNRSLTWLDFYGLV